MSFAEREIRVTVRYAPLNLRRSYLENTAVVYRIVYAKKTTPLAMVVTRTKTALLKLRTPGSKPQDEASHAMDGPKVGVSFSAG